MATTVSFNGSSYSVPAYNDIGWAQGPGNLSSYLVAIASGTLQTTGGTFTLSANVNFGGSFGVIAAYFTTHSASPATSGVLRLAIGDSIKWGVSNLALGVTSTTLTFNGANVPTASALTAGSVVFASAAATLSQDNSNFFWDSTNHRLGIGTTTPGAPLHIFSSSANPVATVEATGAGNVAGVTLKTNSGSGQKEWALSNRGTSETPNNRLAFFYDASEKCTMATDGSFQAVGALSKFGAAAASVSSALKFENLGVYVNAQAGFSVSSIADSSVLAMLAARGSHASKTAVNTGDTLGNLLYVGYAGGTGLYVTAAEIDAVVVGSVTNAANGVGGALSFKTRTTGAGLIEQMRINEVGLVSGSGTSYGSSTVWTPSFGGFSVAPTVTLAQYILVGKVCHVYLVTNAPGTSNATSFTVSLPFAAKSSSQGIILHLVENSGAFLTGPGIGLTTASSTTLTCFKDTGQTASWTNTGGKAVDFSGWYEIA